MRVEIEKFKKSMKETDVEVNLMSAPLLIPETSLVQTLKSILTDTSLYSAEVNYNMYHVGGSTPSLQVQRCAKYCGNV